MPTSLINSYSVKYGIPTAKLEKMWDRAKSIVEQRSTGTNYALVVHILKNMIGIATSLGEGALSSYSAKAAPKKAPAKKAAPKKASTRKSAPAKKKAPAARKKAPAAAKAAPKKATKAPDGTRIGAKAKPNSSGMIWWDKMSPVAQRTYLKKHPGSTKAAVLKKNLKPLDKAPAKRGAAGSKKADTDAWLHQNPAPSPSMPDMDPAMRQAEGRPPDGRKASDISADHSAVEMQNRVADEHSSRDAQNPTPKQRSIFRNLFKVGKKAMKGVYSAVRDFTQGTIEGANEALREYSEPPDDQTEVEPEVREASHNKVMGILGVVAKASLVAGIGVGVFLLAPTLAPSLAEAYFNSRGGRSEASSSLPLTIDSLTVDFTDWLSHQDVEKLAASFKKDD